MKYEITSEIGIDTGHRVAQHGSKCRSLHGHRYRIIAKAVAENLAEAGEETGMVMDFGFLKLLMYEHLLEPCDHACIFDVRDPTFVHSLGPSHHFVLRCVEDNGYHEGQWDWGRVYVVPFTPTAENLAKHWFDRLNVPIEKRSGGRATLSQVIVWETPNHSATYPAP